MHPRAPRLATAALAGVLAGGSLAGCASSTPQPLGSLGGGTIRPAATDPVTTVPTAGTTLASDFTVDVDVSLTGTATQITLLTQAKALILAYEQAVEENNPKDSTYLNLVTGLASTSLYESVSNYQSASQRPTGTLVFYQFTTDETPNEAADVLFCENQAQEKLVNFHTGAPMSSSDTGKQHWDIGFKPGSGGTWTIAYVSAQALTAGSTQCT